MENSIEEITFVENEIKNTRRLFEEVGCYTFFDEDLCKAIEHILSDYKRVLKENEEWDRRFCNLQNLYFKLQDESESKRKKYQETYKDVREELKELKKENEELKADNYELNNRITDLLENIPIQKVKDKIEELKKDETNKYYDMFLEERDLENTIKVLQELLDGSDTNVGSIENEE